MKRYFLLLVLTACASIVSAQFSTYTTSDPVKATIEMAPFHDPYGVVVKYTEAPHPSGKNAIRALLRKQKLEAQKQTPLNAEVEVHARGLLPPPEILASFSGNNIITGTPLDNHLAVGPQEHVISAINVHMLVTNNTGFWLGSYKLDEFFASVGLTNRFFDPRVIYDPEQDRFIMVLINSSECEESQIAIAFSQTNNPRGAWHLYALDGCLDDDGTFADYPMISITKNELFLTYNEVHTDSSWQTGFMGTQIHQINKMSGYAGQSLERKVWRDIAFNGRLLRNILPVRNADEILPLTQHFISTRNFDISNDTCFVLHLDGEYDDPEATLDIGYRLMSQPYGVPPYAVQTRDSMDTNDGRALDGFILNGQIQWVSNSMDFSTGRSAVYHGVVPADGASGNGTAYVIGHPTDYLGYPGIAWTGTEPSQQDAIIVMSHCSPTRHPGGSAIYSDGLGQYSDFLTIIEGQRSVDMLTGPIERWGDYVGIQRLYHQPGSIWIACSYGRPGNVNEAWIAKLAREEGGVSTKDERHQEAAISAYPNPTHDYVTLEIEHTTPGRIEIALHDMQGQPVQVLYDRISDSTGRATIGFSTHVLPAGAYIATVRLDGHELASHTFIKK